MKKYPIKVYQKTDFQAWNDFVANAKNATFLFHRDFMDYHQHRFEDFSLLIFDEKQQLQALVPANRVGDTLFSHQGLTYGGLLVGASLKLKQLSEVLYALLQFLAANAITHFNFKALPAIYSQIPADEMEYLAFILQAKCYRKDLLSVLSLPSPILLSKDRKQGVAKGIKKQLIIKEETTFDAFWKGLLIPNLAQKHQAKPVHSLQEITTLKEKFPLQIRQFNVYFQEEIVAGTTIFESHFVAHSQYIASNDSKNKLGSLDFLHHYLISEVFANKKYFDFGISNENQGKNCNEGLLYWKESFGGRGIVQNFYEIKTSKYLLLETLFI